MQMMMMPTSTPLKDATEDIDDILVDTDGEEEENKQKDENSIYDLSQHSSQDFSQEQNVHDQDGDMSNTAN